ncbi:MAG: ribosomal RNA small subunit methyltransferase A [Candidatus Campbellbacteria bacterium]
MAHRAKKHLGQNFLKSKVVVAKMVAAADILEGDVVLEIGPGKGVLTEALLQTGCVVVAIEKDRELLPLLQEKFQKEIAANKLHLIEDDILQFSPEKNTLLSHGYKLVANIPYYITGEILEKFLSNQHAPSCAVLLVQKEVAQRVVARDGRESILSISVKAFGTPKIVTAVPKKYFSPAPKVDSAVLLINNITKNNFKDMSEKRFFEIVKTGFAHKRKVLTSNLSSLFPKETLGAFFKEHGRPLSVRAEELSLSDWLSLSRR